MKPAPFKNVDYTDPVTKFRVVSNPDTNSAKGSTQVLDPEGKVLWSIPKFIGRYDIDLSPDGKILVLSGDFYFGGQLNLSGNSPLAEVYREGKEIKKVIPSDLFLESLEKIAENRKLSVKGGNWVDLEDFIKDMQIDWNQHTLNFTLYDHSSKKISF